MDVEIFKRNVQLAKLGIAELEGTEKRLYKLLLNTLSELNVYTSDETTDYLYFGKSTSKIVLYYDSKEEALFVHFNRIWRLFRDALLNDFKIQMIISWWVGLTLGLKTKDIAYTMNFMDDYFEKNLKIR